MIHKVTVDGKTIELSIRENGDGYIVSQGGQDRPVAVTEVEPSVYSVLMEGRSFDARLAPGAVLVGSRAFEVQVEDPRAPASVGSSSLAEGPKKITAPMPGKVIRVLVEQGDLVVAGQGLVVVEAMKMQNELRAPKAGRIVAAPAREGAAVAAGDTLLVVE